MRQLAVYLCNQYVGLLSSNEQQRFFFQYDQALVTKGNLPPLSLSLPFQKDVFTDEKARPFFTNILPESRIREAVARKLGISVRNDFALLEALGGECAGAITLLPPGMSIEEQSEYQPLSTKQLSELIRELPKKPFLAGENGIRLSLAGAQQKLPVYLKEEKVYLPKGFSPSTHIIKPKIENLENSVQNEIFCMTLAKKIGIKVPNVRLLKVPDELYLVERYDRYCDKNGQVHRIHQEDFCQASSRMAEIKYESEGGLSIGDCFSLLFQFSTNPALDRKKMVDWVLFNYLIHNADAHAKNISLLLSPNDIRLAPFYDLMCTGVYEGINEKFAMKIGKENRPQWIQIRHWERFAKEINIGAKFILKTLKEMAELIEDQAKIVAAEQEKRWESTIMTNQIRDIIARQVKHIKMLF